MLHNVLQRVARYDDIPYIQGCIIPARAKFVKHNVGQSIDDDDDDDDDLKPIYNPLSASGAYQPHYSARA